MYVSQTARVLRGSKTVFIPDPVVARWPASPCRNVSTVAADCQDRAAVDPTFHMAQYSAHVSDVPAPFILKFDGQPFVFKILPGCWPGSQPDFVPAHERAVDAAEASQYPQARGRGDCRGWRKESYQRAGESVLADESGVEKEEA